MTDNDPEVIRRLLELERRVNQMTAHLHTGDELGMQDNTQNDASTTKHGFLRKLSNVATEFLNGQGLWTSLVHNLLSTTYHGDTTSESVVAGDLLYGNSTPKWARLAKGAEGQLLRMGSTSPQWGFDNGWRMIPYSFTRWAQTTNRALNPSFEVDTASWNIYGTTTLSRVSGGVWGSYCGQAVIGGSGSGYAIVHNNVEITAGTVYTVSFYAKSISGNTSLHSELFGSTGVLDTTITTSWARYSFNGTASSTKNFYIWLSGAGTIQVDGLLITAGASSLQPYFDGSLRTGVHWVGTAHNSQSVVDCSRMTYVGGDLTSLLKAGIQALVYESSVWKAFNVINFAYDSVTTTMQIMLYAGTDATLVANPTYVQFCYGNAPYFPASFTYTPEWLGASGNPSIGNGAIEGKYSIIGNLVTYRVWVWCNTTTTYGSGVYRFSLPFLHSQPANHLVTAVGLDNGTAWRNDNGLTDQSMPYCIIYKDGVGEWQPTVPHTWASGDQMWISGVFTI